jgi:hypothetical protein
LLAAHQSTHHRFVSDSCLFSISSVHSDPVFLHCEFDSHADTCALGCNFVLLSYTGRVCDVSPYNARKDGCEKNVLIVTSATTYTCQTSGQTSILVINEGLWFGHKLSHSRLNQNQLRYHCVTVHDNPFDHTTPLSIEHSELTIPLFTSGTNIFLNTHTPTQHELETCPHLHLTSEAEWNPQTVLLASTRSVEAEDSTTVDVDVEPGLSQISCVYSFTAMAESLHEMYSVSSEWSISATITDVPSQRTFISKERYSAVTAEQLSKRWNMDWLSPNKHFRLQPSEAYGQQSYH